MARLSWLHLSDIHIKHGDPSHRMDQKRVLQALIDGIRPLLDRFKGPPDLIFLTGDVAFSGRAAEYAEAADWFAQLRAKLGAKDSRVYAIPGNHDVDWSKIATAQDVIHEHLWEKPQKVDAFLHDCEAVKFHLWPKLEAFAQFCGAIGAKRIGYDALSFSDDFTTAIGRVHVVGLNTAVLSRKGYDLGHLCLGQRQLQSLPRESRHAVVFALQHHPPAWLADHEVDVVEELLSSQPSLLLHGHRHKHRPVIKTNLDGRGGIVVIPAGAVHNEQGGVERHAFSWGSLSSERGLAHFPRAFRHGGSTPGVFKADADWTEGKESIEVPERALPRPLAERLATLRKNTERRFGSLPATLGPASFVGRADALEELREAFEAENTVICEVIAPEGHGKTELVKAFEKAVLPKLDLGLPANVFLWSFHNAERGLERVPAASSEFFEKFLHKQPDGPRPGPPHLRAIEKLHAIPTLLVLDGFEAQGFRGSLETSADDEMLSFLTKLMQLRRLDNGGLVVVTSRRPLPLYEPASSTTVRHLDLTEPLSLKQSVKILESFDLRGSEEEVRQAAAGCGGHPMALVLLGGGLKRFYGGRAKEFDKLLGQESQDSAELVKRLLQQLDKLNPEERFYLRCASILGRSLRQEELQVLKSVADVPLAAARVAASSAAERGLREGLVAAGLLSGSAEQVWNTHGLVKQYVLDDLRLRQPDLWRQMHKTLFEHFRAVPERNLPEKDVFDLSPYYEAMVMACLIGDYAGACEVYRDKIARGDEGYSTEVAGRISDDLVHLALFFEHDGGAAFARLAGPLGEADRAWLLARTSYCLECEGQLQLAADVRTRSNDIYRRLPNVLPDIANYIAQGEEELALLMVYLGDLAAAEEAARRSIAVSGDSSPVRRIASHAALGTVLHRRGRYEEALAAFRRAEALHTDWSRNDADYAAAPEPLHAAPGARYCELLMDLARSESDYREVLARAQALAAWSRAEGAKARPLIHGAHRLVRGSVHAALGNYKQAQDDIKFALEQTDMLKHETEFGVECLLVQAAMERRRAKRRAVDPVADEVEPTPANVVPRLRSALAFLEKGEEIATRDKSAASVGRSEERAGMPLMRADLALVQAALMFDIHEFEEGQARVVAYAKADRALVRAENIIEACGYDLRLPELKLLRARRDLLTEPGRGYEVCIASLRAAWEHAHRRENLLLLAELTELELQLQNKYPGLKISAETGSA